MQAHNEAAGPEGGAGAGREEHPVCNLYDVVTISREHGSHGGLVGKMLAQKVGYAFYDRELIERIAQISDAKVRDVEMFDERDLRGFRALAVELLHTSYTSASYLRTLRRLVVGLAEQGRAVIVGRGANFILPWALSIRIVAPLEVRVQRIAREFGLDDREAMRRVQQVDEQRRLFVRSVYHQDPDDPHFYHLTVSTGVFSPSEAARFLAEAVSGCSREP